MSKVKSKQSTGTGKGAPKPNADEIALRNGTIIKRPKEGGELSAPRRRVLRALERYGKLTRKEIARRAPTDLARLTSDLGSKTPSVREYNDERYGRSLLSSGYAKIDADGYSITSKGRAILGGRVRPKTPKPVAETSVSPTAHRANGSARSERAAEAASARTKKRTASGTSTKSDIEGLKTEYRLFRTKRSRRLRDAAFSAANGVCCVCERDFSKVLGGRGERVLQVHHREQLSARTAPSITQLDDLAVVCANCHLLLHLDGDKALGVGKLRELLRVDGFLPLTP